MRQIPHLTGVAGAAILLCAIAVAPANGGPPGDGPPRKLALTPDRVFSLWTNINRSLLAIARRVSDDAAWQARLAAEPPQTFQGKRSADVLERVRIYRAKLNRLLKASGIPPARRFRPHVNPVVPGDVYVNSGYLLNRLVEWLIRSAAPERKVGRFYILHNSTGKTPSDVFVLVALADRRLSRILARAGL